MKKPVAFLDFQGTLGGKGIDDIKSFEFYPFAIEAIQLLNANDILAIGITNQGHISKGELTMEEFEVGDMGMADMILAKNINAKGILVLTGVGKGSLNEYRYTWENIKADFIAENVLEAAKWIIRDLSLK